MRSTSEILPDTLDISAFDRQDLLNLVLQRSDVLGYGREASRLIRSWERGHAAPLQDAVRKNGEAYARAAAGIIRAEYETLRGLLMRLKPRRIADIGCGYAIFDLFAYHDLDCDLLLIDIEQSDHRHFGYRDVGAGYSSLRTARRFLTDNGVPPGRITTWNPDKGDLPDGAGVDIAFSFLSCGFHYPVDMYLPFFRFAVAPRGAVILDLRGTRAPQIIAQLEQIGSVRVIHSSAGVKRVLLKKWDKG